MTEDEISRIVVDSAIRVHTKLGPGLFEEVYEAALVHELEKRGLRCLRQQMLPVTYDGLSIKEAYRVDILIEDSVIVELKSVEVVAAVHKKQLLTYLRLGDKYLGLLVNFGAAHIRDGIVRLVNGSPRPPQKGLEP